ncbi:37S ribosomal protein S9, mitochondrial [Neophaeococcomyces mojaviensis]|uniref:37S ribosomal protein S9, mitochondrial n=1 Tax=Neophaeococcomyces mojaviensis TaxID=3383035 RepID=A0ACC3AEE4_9EURO|nr:37S ribosomal protein S9, mitochondrial [Knufia sp. JES_112]
MAQRALSSFIGRTAWTCKRCRANQWIQRGQFSSTTTKKEELIIKAAPEIDLDQPRADGPARIIPASPSYFTGAPIFNDNLLLLQSLLSRYDFLPQVSPDQAPRMAWLRLSQYRSNTGERIAASKYAQILRILTRLNRIHPQLRPDAVSAVLEKFLRPSAAAIQQAKPGKVDEHGIAKGVGRRKESSASVRLVEGTGEILINGKSIVDVFPRLHDRESAMWPLKVSERIDKYNVFALVNGGGVTGQAEAITLGLAKALLVHEPALKPVLRRAGCVTRDPRRVERKKPGRVKARKRPTWVKR